MFKIEPYSSHFYIGKNASLNLYPVGLNWLSSKGSQFSVAALAATFYFNME